MQLGGLLLCMAGCGQLFSLGSECDGLEIACETQTGPLAPDLDADAPDHGDEGGMDETPPPEGEPDAGSTVDDAATLLAFENPAFERKGGVDGDLILQEIFTTLSDVLLPMQPIFASVPGWYSCIPFAVTSSSTPLDTRSASALSASSGNYLTFERSPLSFEFSAARQLLLTPLPAGTRLGLMVDVIARSGGSNNLYLEVRGDPKLRANYVQQCGVAGSLLGRSELIQDSASWQTVCVDLETSEDYHTLQIRPQLDGSPTSTPSLLLDTVRAVPECPSEPEQAPQT